MVCKYGVEKGIVTGVYEVFMMYICCYVVGEDWYDVIMVEMEWYIHGKYENISRYNAHFTRTVW